MDDVIFGATNEFLCKDFANLMKKNFEMNMTGELTFFFFGLESKQTNEGIFINQSKYAKDIFKKFGMDSAKPSATPKVPPPSLIRTSMAYLCRKEL